MVIANNVRLAGTRGARNDETTGDTSVTTVSSINVRIAGTHGARNKAPGGRFFGRVDDGRLDALATAMREVGAMRRTGLHPNLVGLLDEYSDGAAREKRLLHAGVARRVARPGAGQVRRLCSSEALPNKGLPPGRQPVRVDAHRVGQ